MRFKKIVALACVLLVNNVWAELDANDYLDTLQAEAEIEAPAEHQATSSELINKAPNTPAINQFIEFENRHDFEQYLSQNMRGTWMFFNKLDENSKQLVFNSYLKKKQLDKVSSLVQQVYKMTR